METDQKQETTQTAETQEPQTFTQEDVNRILAREKYTLREKYSDYEDLKAKAAKFDELEEANKTELQKAKERADSLQAQIDSMNKANALRELRDEVSREKGVPANLLTGGTKEECEAQADQILSFASKQPGYPVVKDGGEPTGTIKKATRDQFADWLNNGGN